MDDESLKHLDSAMENALKAEECLGSLIGRLDEMENVIDGITTSNESECTTEITAYHSIKQIDQDTGRGLLVSLKQYLRVFRAK